MIEISGYWYPQFPADFPIQRGDILEVKQDRRSYNFKEGDKHALGFDGNNFRFAGLIFGIDVMWGLLKEEVLVPIGSRVDLLDPEIATSFIQEIEGRKPEKVSFMVPAFIEALMGISFQKGNSGAIGAMAWLARAPEKFTFGISVSQAIMKLLQQYPEDF